MYEGRITVKFTSLCWALLLVVLFFQEAINVSFPEIKYLDEIIAICFLVYYILTSIRRKMSNADVSVGIAMLFLLAIGFLGNGISRIEDSRIKQIFDAFNIFKFVFIVWGASRYFEGYATKRYLIHYLALAVKITVLISTVFMIANWCADIGMHTDYRYGIRAYEFIYSRVGGFYSACVIWLTILTAERYCNRTHFNGFFIVLTLINLISSMRSRAFAFAILYIILYYFLILNTKKSNINRKRQWWPYLVLAAMVLAIVGKDQLSYYFAEDSESARNILLRYGIVTATTYFPFGAGFGTYGTAVARDSYSVLYSQYGFDQYWGLSQDFGAFLTDNYWPAIMGEFGFIGVLFMVLLLVLVFVKLYKATDNRYSKVCILFVYGTLLIASTASSAFLACVQPMLFMCLVCKLDFSREMDPITEEKHETINRFYPHL